MLVTGTAASATNGAAGLANADVSSVITSDYSKIPQVDAGNIYTFTSQGNGKYYIMHKESGKYLSINANNSVTLSTTPMALNVAAKNNGITKSIILFKALKPVWINTTNTIHNAFA